MRKTKFIFTLMLGCSLVTMAKATCTNNQTCGDNCCWDLTGGVLTISGTGDMDWGVGTPPWYDQNWTITSVQVSNGITSIGNNAFEEAPRLGSITIPNSVTSIGDYAFFDTPRLDSITIPYSVTSIGDYAFKDSALESINIPEGVTSIGDYAFSSTFALESITIPNSVTSIGDYVFKDSALTSITLSEGVTSIGEGAFSRAYFLTSINIPDSVTSIGDLAFKDSTNLTDITIPDTAALGESLFNGLDLSKVTLHCAGVLEQCQENMRNAGYEVGTYNMVQAPYSKKQADGSRAYYDANGNLIALKGKRIYTLDEANKITGAKNRVSIKYR